MCLDRIKKVYKRHRMVKAFKVLVKDGDQYEAPFQGNAFRLGKTYKDNKEQNICCFLKTEWYQLGYHAYKNKKEAISAKEHYKNIFHENAVVLEISGLAHTRGTEADRDVYVLSEMTLIDEAE